MRIAIEPAAPAVDSPAVGEVGRTTTSVERLRLFAMSAGIALVMVLQDSGRVATDTKLDLVVAPGRFLRQALSLWDPIGEGGRIQNQAYGYLFPMGPFFLLFDSFGVPGWAVQRFWEAALLICAFIGTFVVARALGVVGFWPAASAGLAYALTPRVLSELTYNSAELLPSMVMPWVLLPLIRGSVSGSPRRQAALSGLALLFAGGTNAGATLAILPVPALWLLTRRRGPRRTALIRWWAIAATLSMIWWFIPLLLLGRYSPPFLEWIEAAENTTTTTSMLAVLRGVPHWVSYLGEGYWPAGWRYVSTPALIVATTAVAAFGLVGLARRNAPNRTFLVTCLIAGTVAVTLGHSSQVGPLFDGAARNLLDGPLIPVRNVHKFQAIVTLPLAVGIGLAADRLRPIESVATRHPAIRARRIIRSGGRLALPLIVGAVSLGPVFDDELVAAGRSVPVASWWQGAASWLGQNSAGSRALILPGAPFPTYLWGETVDDAFQPIAESPWVVRSAAPLAQPGLIRLLDVVENRFASGTSDRSLAAVLARSGIGFVVLRNDLDAPASAATPQSIVRTTLVTSPGFERVAAIGPRIGEQPGRPWLVDGGAGGARAAIEIFRVASAAGPVSRLSLDGAVRANGSADGLGSLVSGGLAPSVPVFFGADGTFLDELDAATVTVVTDGVRRQQDAFGGPFRRSRTLTATEPFSGSRRTFDYLPDDVGNLSTYRYIGIDDVLTSSSGSDVRVVFSAAPAEGPWSALDGDPRSAWRTATWTGSVGEWIEVRFLEPIELDHVTVMFSDRYGPLPVRVRATTDAGTLDSDVRPDARRQRVETPPEPTTTLRLSILAVDGGGRGSTVGLAELEIPGVSPERTLEVPDAGTPDILRFSASAGHRQDCLAVGLAATCGFGLERRGEEDDGIDRTFVLAAAGDFAPSATVRLVPGPTLNRLLDEGHHVAAGATSVDALDPRHRPAAAVDGNLSTAWVADPDDEDPRLTLTFDEPREIRALRILTDGASPIARPTSVWIEAGSVDWIGRLPADGLVVLPAEATTRRVRITVIEMEERESISLFSGFAGEVPVGISEIRFDPTAPDNATPAEFDLGCDEGLEIVAGGTRVPMAVRATLADVLAGLPVVATPCGDASVTLDAGENRIQLPATSWIAPVSVMFTAQGADLVGRDFDGSAVVEHNGATSARVAVDAATASVLVVHANYNDGWVARLGDDRLDSVRVDGWQQGFVIPAGAAGDVTMTYEPQRVFVGGLLAGSLGVPALVAMAWWRPRRDGPGSVGERPIGERWAIAVALVAATVLGGAVAAVATATAVVVDRWLLVAFPRVRPLVAGAMLLLAGLITGASSSVVAHADAPAIQTLCVTAVAMTVVSASPRPSRGSSGSDRRPVNTDVPAAANVETTDVIASSLHVRPLNGG